MTQDEFKCTHRYDGGVDGKVYQQCHLHGVSGGWLLSMPAESPNHFVERPNHPMVFDCFGGLPKWRHRNEVSGFSVWTCHPCFHSQSFCERWSLGLRLKKVGFNKPSISHWHEVVQVFFTQTMCFFFWPLFFQYLFIRFFFPPKLFFFFFPKPCFCPNVFDFRGLLGGCLLGCVLVVPGEVHKEREKHFNCLASRRCIPNGDVKFVPWTLVVERTNGSFRGGWLSLMDVWFAL